MHNQVQTKRQILPIFSFFGHLKNFLPGLELVREVRSTTDVWQRGHCTRGSLPLHECVPGLTRAEEEDPENEPPAMPGAEQHPVAAAASTRERESQSAIGEREIESGRVRRFGITGSTNKVPRIIGAARL